MAGDKRSGGGGGALTDLARRGRGDKVGRDLKPSRCRHHRHGSAVAAGPTYTPCLLTQRRHSNGSDRSDGSDGLDRLDGMPVEQTMIESKVLLREQDDVPSEERME
jgi:hypothetical protein